MNGKYVAAALLLSVMSPFSATAAADGLSLPQGGAKQVEDSFDRRNFTFSKLGDRYGDFKDYLRQKYGFDYALDVSYMPQRTTPNGKKTAWQTLVSPSFTWTVFSGEKGTGTVNFAYTVARYGGTQATRLAANSGMATAVNDNDDKGNSFDELYFNYRFGGSLNWLSLAAGQFPIANFDGGPYNSSQQVNFINFALSQNASSTYPTAGVGAYAQAAVGDWSFAFGAQNAADVDGSSISFDGFGDNRYASFGYLAWNPEVKGLGGGQYSLLLYNQPWVKAQKQTTNGWSLNLTQNIGKKFAVFARVNGVSGSVAEIRQSWVLGMVYNNPFDRNPLDQAGLAFACNKIDEAVAGERLAHDSEKIVEAYYAFGISKWMTVTPDVQLYIDPALNEKSDYGAAFSLRFSFFF